MSLKMVNMHVLPLGTDPHMFVMDYPGNELPHYEAAIVTGTRKKHIWAARDLPIAPKQCVHVVSEIEERSGLVVKHERCINFSIRGRGPNGYLCRDHQPILTP